MRRNKKGYLLAGLILPAALLIGITAHAVAAKPDGVASQTVNQPKTVETSGAAPAGPAVPDYAVLKQNLEDYLATRPGQWSVYVEDLSTGANLNLAGDQPFVAASTIKLPLILDLYEQAAWGNVDLDSEMTYTAQYYEQGSGILQGQPFGGRYNLRELSRLAIENSDNVAKNMIEAYVGEDNFIAFMQSLGAEGIGRVDGNLTTTAHDMASYLDVLLAFRTQHPALGNEILYYMEHSVYDPSGLPQELPAGTVVAHKMGALNDKWNDVGIVFAGSRPYIIAVFSQNGQEDASLQTIADVSRIVYNFQTSL